MKLVYTLSIAGILLFSCQQDPQKNAENKADRYSDLAQSEAAAAQSDLEQAQDNANSAVIHATQAEMNEALSKVEVPQFDSKIAEEEAKKLANHGIEYVNANDHKQADKYSEKMDKDIQRVNSLQEKGTISESDGDKIRNYAQSLAAAIQLNITVVEFVPTENE